MLGVQGFRVFTRGLFESFQGLGIEMSWDSCMFTV